MKMDKTEKDNIRRLKYTICAIFVMLLLMPYKEQMAVTEGSVWWTHLTYMFAHGNLIHIGINAWALLMLHKILMAYRVAVAWVVSVLISYVYYPELPVVGASTVIMFMTGYAMPWIKQRGGWASIITICACISVGFVIPQLAGMYHLLCTVAGLVFFFIDRWVQTTWTYCVND